MPADGGIKVRKRYRPIILIIVDIVLIYLSYILSFIIRFEGKVPSSNFNTFVEVAFILIAIKIVTFFYFKLYENLWRYAGLLDMLQVIAAIGTANAVAISYLFLVQANLPRSIYVLVSIMDVLLIGGSRFGYRVLRELYSGRFYAINKGVQDGHITRVLIIGAGEAGAMVIKELKKHRELHTKPVGILDDDRNKHRRKINGIPVLGDIKDVKQVAEDLGIQEIIIALPSTERKHLKRIIGLCKDTKCRLKTLPGVYELIDGKVSVKHIRDVEIEDLLGREPVDLNIGEISGYLKGKIVLVTGGGGSIGSELCRQIARFEPEFLLILDINENNAYTLQMELLRRYPGLNTKIIIASVRDKARLNSVFGKYRPQVVFHAAAHKHVPLMEDNPTEAVKNNVFGTLNTAECSDVHKVEKFVLVSTDKAVNPANVMGASKRVAEVIVQMKSKESGTKFTTVRFGNVLGSSGSVIPLFKSQIAGGGPVTVTHRDITRYFMTIPEAGQLVIQAGAMAKGGEVFVLDMGEPVKIMDLARDLIRLSGFEPDRDIAIEIIGLRPGEKLYEELFLAEEELRTTEHDKIFIGRPFIDDGDAFKGELDRLKALLICEDWSNMSTLMNRLVPIYRDESC